MSGPEARCAHCGSALGIGRFCTNCGMPIGSTPGDAIDPVYGEPVYREPAYDAPGDDATGDPLLDYEQPDADQRRGLPAAWLWVAAAVVVMVVVLVAGWSLLLRGSDGGSTTTSPPKILPRTNATASASSSPTATSGSPSVSPSTTASSPPPAHPVDVAGLARASAPTHAPAAIDFNGSPVTYVAGNLVDGSTETCWRTPGDATGTVLTFHLAQPTTLTRVGLINGYAKTAYSGSRRFDWYLGNRRVLSVDWVFDDGTSVSQLLTETRALQRLTVPTVTTSTVRLRITAVSPPGTGPAARDDTAISEVALVGTPAG